MRKYINELRKKGLTNFDIFEQIIGEHKLYCIAFGHKGTKQQKAKIRYINKLVNQF